MKKICLGGVIGFFLISMSFFAPRASGGRSIGAAGGRNGGSRIPMGVRSTRTDVSSLPSGLQSVLSQTLGADNPQYRVTRSGGEYRVVNGRSGLRARIGPDGLRVRAGSNEWGLRLTGWGRGRCLQKTGAGRARAGSNRVDIDRGGITEWWVNGPLGIEQGWTVAERPDPGRYRGRLTVVLRQSGDMRTQVVSRGRTLAVSGSSGEVLRYTGLTAYDKNGHRLPAHFVATRQDVRVVVDDTGAAYPVHIDPWIEAAKLRASDGAAYDQLGGAVAVSSDGSTVVAGAWSGATGNAARAVYVFKEPPSGWANGTETAKLTASDGEVGDLFGWSVAVSPDGKTVVAGAPYANVGTNASQGAVYIFKQPASGWTSETQTAKLTASDGVAGDFLGNSVAMSSDGTTIVAGAEGAGAAPELIIGGNNSQGAVYVFQEPASGWADGTQTAKLTVTPGAYIYILLGRSVAVSSDGTTVAAGAVGGNENQGSVYIFKEPDSGWADGTQTATLTASDGAAYDRLGGAVAMSSDGATVVAGAEGPPRFFALNSAEGLGSAADSTSEGDPGVVYIFKEPASGWASGTETAELTASDGAAFYFLGCSVAVTPDGTTVVAGATGATVGGNSGQGAEYVFKEPASGWTDGTETAKLTALDGASSDGLGSSVAVSSDGGTVVGGTSGAILGSNTSQGSVYIFSSQALWQNAQPLGNGWYYLDWFGYFYSTNNSPWIYHCTLGWLYPFGTSTDSIWFWDQAMHTCWWTSQSTFPFVYRANDGTWLWYEEWTNPPVFYNPGH